MSDVTELTAYFNGLPGPMRRLLLHGSFGCMHLLQVAEAGLAHIGQAADQPATMAACADILMHCWAESPLDTLLAGRILATGSVHPFLPPQALPLLRAVSTAPAKPAESKYFDNLRQRREFDKLGIYLTRQLQDDHDNLFWRAEAVSLAMFTGRFEDACGLVDAMPEAMHELTSGLYGVGHLLAGCAGQGGGVTGDAGSVNSGSRPATPAGACAVGAASGVEFERMLDGFRRAAAVFGQGYALGREGLALARLGRRDEAVECMRAGLRHSPWQTSLALRLFDLEHGVDLERTELPGQVAVLLYSWNKAEELDETLTALHASELGDARIYALDNGSTDHTPQVLARWAERFAGRMEVVTLPVNVGAAAARNWLMHLEQVRHSDWVVYLDDDAVVGTDWLGALGAAAASYPDAGVWGCKVLDAHAPHLIQAADYHLVLPPVEQDRPDPDLGTVSPSPSRLSNLHVQGFDMGQFDYMRPCTSVTGCCHLFRTQRLLEVGDFSLSLSPSQYDDLERDLRMVSGGGFAVYTGHVPVLHRKRTGAAARTSPAQEANALGNRYKMQVMHPRGELAAAEKAQMTLLQSDLLSKLSELG